MRLRAITLSGLVLLQLAGGLEADPIPFAEAASLFRRSLPKGCIVTAECVDRGPVNMGVTGRIEPSHVPPERVIFEIGSISKVFTGLLLAQTLLEDKITLDTTLRELMGPEQTFEDPAVAAITVQQLITHTSGLPRLPANLDLARNAIDPYAKYDRTQLNAAVARQKLRGSPPFARSYSNYGVGLLGDLLARLHGETWEALVKQRITGPLGMHDTTMALTEEQLQRLAPPYEGEKPMSSWRFTALAGAGALRSTAADMVRFGQALLSPESTPFPSAIELLHLPQTPDGKIGLAIMLETVDSEPVFEHNGATAGYRALLQLLPASRTVRVLLSNNAVIEPAQVANAIRNEKPRTRESGKMLTEAQLSEYPGMYVLRPGLRFTIVRRGPELWTQLTGQAFLRLYPHELPDRFFLKAAAAEVQFNRRNGKIVSLTNCQNGRETLAERSTQPLPPLLFRDARSLNTLTGVYELAPGKEFKIKETNGILWAQLTGQPFLPLFERRKDWFEYDTIKAALEFETQDGQHATALRLHQNGVVQRAVKRS